MTTDERISTDLAVVGRVSRERPIAVEATLRKVGALPAPRMQPSSSGSNALALLRLSRIYALRVARTWAGTAAVVCTVVLVAYTVAIHAIDWGSWEDGAVLDLSWISKGWVAIIVAAAVSSVYVASLRLALHRFQGLVAGSELKAVHERVRHASRWSAWASISGAMTCLLFFGMMQVTIGGGPLCDLYEPGPLKPSLQLMVADWTMIFVSVAIVSSVVGALLDVRRARVPSTARIVVGVVLVIATIMLGLRYDAGPGYVLFPERMPSMWFRGCLTVTGTVGLYLVVSTIALRIRAREDKQLDEVTSAGG